MQKINKLMREVADDADLAGGGVISILGVDCDKLNELADKLTEYSDNMSGCLEKFYYILKHLEDDAWSGEYYEAFYKSCLTYEDGLKLYVATIAVHADIFRTIATEGEQLITDVKNACSRFSGSYQTSGGGGR